MKKMQYLKVCYLACHISYFKIAVTAQEHFHDGHSIESII